MAKETIGMEEVHLNLEDFEIGGARRIDLRNIDKSCKFKVESAELIETKWGGRVDFHIKDEYDHFILSSWNIITPKKIRANDLVGKTILVAPTANEKKVSLLVLD